MNGYAHLAYGYDLGPIDAWKADPRDEDYPDLPWFDPDDDDVSFADAAAEMLTEAGIEGIEAVDGGHCDYPGWMLVVTATKRQVEWPSALVLDLLDMEHPPGWDLLEAAVKALGITPHQPDPKWLAFMSYG